MITKNSNICRHCSGHIVTKYDESYCINCSRPANQPQTVLSGGELEQDLKRYTKAEKLMRQRTSNVMAASRKKANA